MKVIFQSLRSILIATFIFGIAYPGAVWVFGLVLFPKYEPKYLVGQNFESPHYFWGRPSQNSYATMPAEPTNLGPTSKKLKTQIEERRLRILKAHPGKESSEIPEVLLMGSASGVDPDLTLEGVFFQIDRVTAARNMSKLDADKLLAKIDELTERPSLGILGRERINILRLNEALDEISPKSP